MKKLTIKPEDVRGCPVYKQTDGLMTLICVNERSRDYNRPGLGTCMLCLGRYIFRQMAHQSSSDRLIINIIIIISVQIFFNGAELILVLY